jgi:hypothetical protein
VDDEVFWSSQVVESARLRLAKHVFDERIHEGAFVWLNPDEQKRFQRPTKF